MSPTKFGGSHDDVLQQFPDTNSFIVVSSVSRESCCNDAGVARGPIPAIAMLERDHRALRRLRLGKEKKGEFEEVIKREVAEILAVSRFYELNGREWADYSVGIVQMLYYCRDEQSLIGRDQCDCIIKELKLKRVAFC